MTIQQNRRRSSKFALEQEADGALAGRMLIFEIGMLQHDGGADEIFDAAGPLALIERSGNGNLAVHFHARRPELVFHMHWWEKNRLNGIIPLHRLLGEQRSSRREQ